MERKRLNGQEQKEFLNLCAAESLLHTDRLTRRIAGLESGAERLQAALDALNGVVYGVMGTMPIEQLESYHKQMRHIAIMIGVKRADNFDDWDGRYLKFSEINALLEGCGDHCLMCDKEPATMKRCPIRRVYNSLPADTVCSGLSCDE